MKNIIFNATILDDKLTGLGVYSKNILQRLDDNIFTHIIYTDKYKENAENTKDVVIKIESKNKLKKIFLRNYKVNKFLTCKKGFKTIHYSPTQHGSTNSTIKQIITIHDLIPLYYPSGRFQQYIYYKYILKKIINNSQYIITVSNNTKNDIIKEYNINEDKIKVIYNGFDDVDDVVDKDFSKKYVLEKYNLDNFILMVGIHYNYKNLHSVIEAYSNLKDLDYLKIAIVGDDSNEYANSLKQLVKEKEIEDKVVFLGFVSNNDKNHLYRASKIFMYPSKYEGFGLPVLEAMANQTLVACSNNSSLKEVVLDAAYTFDPNNVGEIENAIKCILKMSYCEYNQYIERGKERIKYFSWDKCAQQVQEVITSLIDEEK